MKPLNEDDPCDMDRFWARLHPNRFGLPGVRDPNHPCEMFEPTSNIDWLGLRITVDGSGNCDSDGHYLCNGCIHLSKKAVIERSQ